MSENLNDLPRPDPEREQIRQEELRASIEKKEAKVRRMLEKHGLELDRDTEEIIAAIVEQGVRAKGLEKVIDKDWIITEELKLLYKTTRDSTRQRILEFLAEMGGMMPQGQKGMASWVADVTMEALNER